MHKEDSIDQFKRATAAAVKAIGHRREMEVAFTRGGLALSGKRVQLPAPTADFSPQEKASLRGAADSAALRLRYHRVVAGEEKLHDMNEKIFSTLEQARCEALGTGRMPGARRNVGAFLDEECRRKGLSGAKEKKDVPIAEALRLLAHEKLGGGAVPPNGAAAVALWRAEIEKNLAPYWPRLAVRLADQEAYAAECRRLLLALAPFVNEEDGEEKARKEDEKQAIEKKEPEKNEEEKQTARTKSKGETAQEDEDGAPAEASADAGAEEETEEETRRAASASNDARGPVTTYRIFTDTFDETVKAETLCSGEELSRLRKMLDRQMQPVQGAVIRLANKLQRLLLAQQLRAWDFDLEEGVIDAARLARIVVNPLEPLSYKMERETDFRDTVVGLLIDNSGSMRGRPMMLAAISADILARTLERCGVKTEVLGFTTRAWKGGRAREKWVADGKPPRPGRLNELRHVIYKQADAPWRRARNNLGLLLREGLLKENIDGEALLWAHERLVARPEDRRILMVISDGAPVDDSTQSVNPAGYLDAHLRSVIDWIEARSPVELVAIGIGHDVTRYYKRAVTITDPEQLGGTMTQQLAALFERA